MRWAWMLLVAAVGSTVTGCSGLPGQAAMSSKVRTLSEQVAALEAENSNLRASHQHAVDAAQRAEKAIAQLEKENSSVAGRLTETERQRNTLKSQFTGLVRNPQQATGGTGQKLAQLAKIYPSVSFDPDTGIGKLEADIMFETGGTELRPEAKRTLKELTAVFMTPEAADLRIMVVGHTDPRAIASRDTRDRYPTNWHLSSSRGLEVADYLRKLGFPEDRMGLAAFAGNQPIAAGEDVPQQAKNRRVEIFLVGPETPVVGWVDTHPSVY